jgi:hypothetical protein
MKFDWGKGILLFFVVFLTLATIFIVFSLRQNNDLVTDDYYEQGADYTNQMETNQRSAIYADSLIFSQNQQTVTIVFCPDIVAGGKELTLHFYYAPDKQKDYILQNTSISDSVVISKKLLAHGRNILKTSWKMKERDYYLEKTIFID